MLSSSKLPTVYSLVKIKMYIFEYIYCYVGYVFRKAIELM